MLKIENKAIKLRENVWYWRGKFLTRTSRGNNQVSWMIYNKYENHSCKDFSFEARDLKTLVSAMGIFEENIPAIIVPELGVSGADNDTEN